MTKEEKRQASVKRYNDKSKEKRKQWYADNKERIKQRNLEKKDSKSEYNKEYYTTNKEREKQRVAEYRKANPHITKEYRLKSKDIRNNWEKQKRLTDDLFRLKQNIKSAIRGSFKRSQYQKISKTQIILGCSYEVFKTHLESKFESWMNWDNYGKYNGTNNFGWDIDHIIPLSTVITVEDIVRLNHFTNLQPLCSKINRDIKKGLISS